MFAHKTQKNVTHRSRYFLIEIGVLFFLIIIDCFVKIFAIRHFDYLCNPGIAFGVQIPFIFFAGLWITIIVALGCYWYTRRARQWIEHMSFVFIFAGAIGNIFDRVRYGCVIDYIPFFRISSFNIADVLISVGACALLYYTMKK